MPKLKEKTKKQTKKIEKAPKPAAKAKTKIIAGRKEKPAKRKTGAGVKAKIKYFSAVGRRKTAVARVRLFTHSSEVRKNQKITINGKPYQDYFFDFSWQKIIEAPLKELNCFGQFDFSIKTKGSGFSAQAEASRMGISRALILLNSYFAPRLRKAGFLTRDSRTRERKKFGLKRARRAPQWSKR